MEHSKQTWKEGIPATTVPDDKAKIYALAAALQWALDQLYDDLDLDHQEALQSARAALKAARGE